MTPEQALKKAKKLGEYKGKTNRRTWHYVLFPYQETIVHMRRNKWSCLNISKFLRDECSVQRGSGPMSVQKFLESIKEYKPLTVGAKNRPELKAKKKRPVGRPLGSRKKEVAF